MIQYDNHGRMKYHPDYHENHGTAWGDEDKSYLCSMHDTLSTEDLSMALGRTQATVATQLYELRKQGKYEHYRRLGKAI